MRRQNKPTTVANIKQNTTNKAAATTNEDTEVEDDSNLSLFNWHNEQTTTSNTNDGNINELNDYDDDNGNGNDDSDGLETLNAQTSKTTVAACQDCMLLFANLLSITDEWRLDGDELQLEFVFELFRCNHDKLAKQLIVRIKDKQMLSDGLLKICSQRLLVLFGLSPARALQANARNERVKSNNNIQWRQRLDRWSLFQPNVTNWLKSIQQEELQQQLAELNFSLLISLSDYCASNQPSRFKSMTTTTAGSAAIAKSTNDDNDRHDNDGDADDDASILGLNLGTTTTTTERKLFIKHMEQTLGLSMFALRVLQIRTKSVLELITNFLDGRAARLAYDLLQLLESGSGVFEREFMSLERSRWLKEQQVKKKSTSRGVTVATEREEGDEEEDEE